MTIQKLEGESMADRKLRIAVVTETYPPEINGVAMTIIRMVEGLRQKHVVELIRPRQNAQDYEKHEPTLQEILVRGFPIPRYQGLKLGLPAKQRLIKLWTSKRPDVARRPCPLPANSASRSAAIFIPIFTVTASTTVSAGCKRPSQPICASCTTAPTPPWSPPTNCATP
jgi:hypothetical protein